MTTPRVVPPALRLALMAERVLPRGMLQKELAEWGDVSVICVCGHPLTIVGRLDSPLGVECSGCGAVGPEAQSYDGPPSDWTPPKIEGELYYNPSTKQLEEWPWA